MKCALYHWYQTHASFTHEWSIAVGCTIIYAYLLYVINVIYFVTIFKIFFLLKLYLMCSGEHYHIKKNSYNLYIFIRKKFYKKYFS
jgi:hypothetical protein